MQIQSFKNSTIWFSIVLHLSQVQSRIRHCESDTIYPSMTNKQRIAEYLPQLFEVMTKISFMNIL